MKLGSLTDMVVGMILIGALAVFTCADDQEKAGIFIGIGAVVGLAVDGYNQCKDGGCREWATKKQQ